MHFRILPLVLILSITNAFSQNEFLEFGGVSLADLKMLTYEKDTSAHAVILINKGSITLDLNSTAGTTFTKHCRIKIFRKSAFAEWADLKFLIEKNGLRKFKAATHNLVNGKIETSEIRTDQILRKKHDKYNEEVTVAFPNVKEGSILEFEYTTMCENAYLPVWQFQYTIPVVRSEFIYVGPSKVTHHLSGEIQPTDYAVKHNGSRHEWLMINVPAFKAEPLMPNKEAYLSRLQMAQKKTWGNICADLIQNQNMGQILLQHNFLNSRVSEITAGMTEPLQKIKAISEYVKNSVSWNGISDYLGYEPQDVLEKKSGSSGDINLLYASMLKKAGIKVGLVLLSTRNNGYVSEAFPSSGQFNYVVCQVTIGDEDLLLDATEKNLPYDMLPPRCFNHNGFLVSFEQCGWIGLEPFKREKISLNANMVLSDDGSLKGQVKASKDGYAAFNSREKLVAGEDTYKKDSFIHRYANVQKSEILNTKEIDKPLVETYELSLDDYATVSADLIYFNPFLFLREESNPFVLNERVYPIDFSSLVDQVVVYNITIPEGYGIEELPQSKVFTLPENAAKCTFNITLTNNKIVVMSRLQINKTLFAQEEYPNLKEFYARLVAKNSENVVLKKKS